MRCYTKIWMLICVCCSSLFAETVIYSDVFDGAPKGQLDGRTPNVAPEGISWESTKAGTPWMADGSIGTQDVNQNRNAFLPFVPEAGNVYVLSMEMSPDGPVPGEFFAMGFSSAANASDAYVSRQGMDVSPWMFVSSDGTVRTYTGPGNAGNVAVPTPKEGWGEDVCVSIQLDTRTEPWSAEWFVNGNSVRTHKFYAGNPDVKFVTFGRFRRASGVVDNFKLTILDD